MREARPWVAEESESDHPVVLTVVETFSTELVGVVFVAKVRGDAGECRLQGILLSLRQGRLPLREGRQEGGLAAASCNVVFL